MAGRKIQRTTPQRRVIMDALLKAGTHPTAAELYEIVRRRLPKISLGTVYRNLDVLAEAGTIEKLEISGSEARFDGTPGRHYHVRCARCGRVDDVHGLPDDLLGKDYQNLSGYEIIGHRLEFVGICPGCRRQQATENGECPHRSEEHPQTDNG